MATILSRVASFTPITPASTFDDGSQKGAGAGLLNGGLRVVLGHRARSRRPRYDIFERYAAFTPIGPSSTFNDGSQTGAGVALLQGGIRVLRGAWAFELPAIYSREITLSAASHLAASCTVEAAEPPVAQLSVTINETTRYPLQARTSVVLEQTRGNATMVVRDLDASITINIFDEVIVDDGVDNIFRGLVLRVRKVQGRLSRGRDLVLTCVDASWRFAHPPKLISASYSNASDQDIVIDLFAQAGLDSEFTVDSSSVQETKTGITVTFGPRWTLQQALNHLMDLTGARGYLDADGVYSWNLDADAPPAPWDVDCDSPNYSTTHNVIDLEVEESFDQPGNDIDVVGGEDPNGKAVKATGEDATSISNYGRFKMALEDAGWLSQATVDDILASALASYKHPAFEFKFQTREDGLRPNQLIKMDFDDFDLSAKEAVIRRVEFLQQSESLTKYTVQGGDRPRSVEALMRRLRAARQSAQSVSYVLGLDFIAGGDFASAGDAADFRSLAEMCISFWIYPRAKPSGSAIPLFHKGDGLMTGSGFSLRWRTDDKLEFSQATFSTNNHSRTVAGVLPLNQWTHVLVNSFWTVAPAMICINGVEASYESRSQPNNAGQADDGSPVRFGENLDGVMALVQAWDNWRNSDQIAALSAKPDRSKASGIATSEMIGFWPLDDQPDGTNATSVADASGKGHTATCTGGPDHRLIPFVPA